METLLLITLIVAAIIIAIWKESINWNNAENSFRKVDEMHESEWNGTHSDELLAWYRVRQRVFADSISRQTRDDRLNAINVRIEQCRYRQHTWHSVAQIDDKPKIISTLN